MTDKTQSLSIRLLRQDADPHEAVRQGVHLAAWSRFDDALIATGGTLGSVPGWTEFLELGADERADLWQRSAYGLVFLRVDNRWFAVSFGLGHAKLEPAAVEQDFGLRVVVNAVDHRKLRSADLRTPDATTLSRRSQTSRGSERDAFAIDPERDIVRGLLGVPKDPSFATRVSGSDALTIHRKMSLGDLPGLCSHALALHQCADYKEEFGWIDQIRHVREKATLAKLDAALVAALTAALGRAPEEVDNVGLAFPTVYDPDRADWVKFTGFGHRSIYPDLEIAHYLAGMAERGISEYEPDFLRRHRVQECDEDGEKPGQSWPVADCLVFETELDGERYTLSGGRWYRIDPDLAKEVADYFRSVSKVEMPPAHAGDNEKKYNARLAAAGGDLLEMDVKLVKPSGSGSPIELCDFLGKDGRLVHVKDKTESSRLSHLWNQGLVSAVALKSDRAFRDRVREVIGKQPGGAAFVDVIPAASAPLDPRRHQVVFAVLANGASQPSLPFFSLISFRHAAKRINDELGFPVAFGWIKKPGAGTGKKPPRRKKA